MKKQKLLLVSFILSLGIGLSSCNYGTGRNVSQFPAAPAVIDYDSKMGGTVAGTPWGVIAAPSLTDVPGSCIYMLFSIDYDNQPATQYYTATEIQKIGVDQSPFYIQNTNELSDYTLPISNVNDYSPWFSDRSATAFLRGRYFIWMVCYDKAPSFRLIYNAEESDDANGVKNLYLQARPSSSTGTVTDSVKVQAFDLSPLIGQYGRDTLNNTCKYIRMNLKYFSGMSDNGEPNYKTLNSSGSPIEIYVYK